MRKTYGQTLWKVLHEYGVWQPGSDVRLGDYGRINESCFERLGNVMQATEKSLPKIREASLESLMIVTDHAVQSHLDADQAHLGQLQVSFEGKSGVLVMADGIIAQSISDIPTLNALVDDFDGWKQEYRIVTSVRRCRNYAVYATGSRGGALMIEAKPSILSELAQGIPNLNGRFDVAGATGLQLKGSDGAISIQAHRRALWGSDLKQLATSVGRSVEKEILIPYIEPIGQD